MRSCPHCSAVVDGVRCHSCGYTEPGAAVPIDSTWRLCTNVFAGQRCANVGSFSHSTAGGGAWLCWQHFAPNATRYPGGVRLGPPGGFQSLRAVLRRIDPEAAAERDAIAFDGAPLPPLVPGFPDDIDHPRDVK
jgi:hypothetical protein